MNKEWDIKDHEMRYDEELDIIFIKLNGVFSVEAQRELTRVINEEFKDSSGGKHAVFDLSNSSMMGLSSSERQELSEEVKNNPSRLEKIALVGASPPMRIVARIIQKIGGIDNDKNRFFKTQEEAMDWIKE